MNDDQAHAILEQTKKDYNEIAGHFSLTRSYFWPDVRFLLDCIPAYSKLLDDGCGNGRLWGALKEAGRTDIKYTGIDISEELVRIAKERFKGDSVDFEVADALNLPFSNHSFETVCSFAVLHHIPGTDLRKQFLGEASRVLQPSGLFLATCWNLRVERYLPYLRHQESLRLKGESVLDEEDALIPWKEAEGKILAERYVHNFTPEKLSELARDAGFSVKKADYSSREITRKGQTITEQPNVFLIAKKP